MLERWWLHSCTKSGWDGSRDGHSCMSVDQARIQKTRLASRSFASRSSDSGNTFYRGTSRVYTTAWAEKQDPLPERARRRQMYDSHPLLPRTKTPTSAKTLQILEPHTNTTTSKPILGYHASTTSLEVEPNRVLRRYLPRYDDWFELLLIGRFGVGEASTSQSNQGSLVHRSRRRRAHWFALLHLQRRGDIWLKGALPSRPSKHSYYTAGAGRPEKAMHAMEISARDVLRSGRLEAPTTPLRTSNSSR